MLYHDENHKFLEDFLINLKLRRYKHNSARTYRAQLKHYLDALDARSLSIKAVTPRDFVTLAEDWLALPISTFNSRVSCCRKLHAWLVSQGIQHINPVQSDLAARRPTIDRPVLSDREVAAIIMAGDRMTSSTSLSIRLMAHSGLRISECRKVIPSSLQHFPTASVFSVDSDKFSKSRLCILTSKVTARLLDDYITRNHRAGKYVFLSAQQTCQRAISSVADKLSFPATTHDLRRYYATKLAKEGVPVPLISRLLGHSHIATTQAYIFIKDIDLLEHFGISAEQELPTPPVP